MKTAEDAACSAPNVENTASERTVYEALSEKASKLDDPVGTRMDSSRERRWLASRIDAVLVFTMLMTTSAFVQQRWGPPVVVIVALIGLAGISLRAFAGSRNLRW